MPDQKYDRKIMAVEMLLIRELRKLEWDSEADILENYFSGRGPLNLEESPRKQRILQMARDRDVNLYVRSML